MKPDTSLNIGRVRFNGSIWETASEFNRAANLLYDTGLAGFSTAILMNYAFACELALKSCAVQKRYNSKPVANGIIPSASCKSEAHGHKLDEVFDQLSDEIKKTVSREFKNITNTELRPQLVEFRDYFSIRYSFEKRSSSYNLSGMQELANALIDATLDAAKTTDGFSES